MNNQFLRKCVVRLFVVFMFLFSLEALSIKKVFASTPTIRYVASTGSDSGSCNSSGSPCQTIQYAVNKSSSGDTILVSQGTYIYSSKVDVCSSYNVKPASVVCFVDKSLTILGGYSTSNWSMSSPSLNLTVIDGQNTYRGVYSIGYADQKDLILDMEGFTIQNGVAKGPTGYDDSGIGGGMLIQHVSVILRDMVFENNQSIGQSHNSGDGGPADGAGLRIEYAPASSTSLLQRVTFDNNKSYGGTGKDRGGIAFGALFIAGSSATIEDSTFTNNLAQAGCGSGSGTSSTNGLHADALGGAIGIENGVTLILNRLKISGNQVVGGNADQIGGGAFGGAILVEDTTSFTMNDSIISNNTAIAGNAKNGGVSGGGGIQGQNDGEVDLNRVQILSNVSTGGNSTGGGNAGSGAGGGLYFFATKSTGSYHVSLTNIIVANNLAQQGTGITSTGNGGAGGISIQGINGDITHATIAGNRLGTNLVCGEGLLVQPWPLSSTTFLPSVVNLNYSIIADHTVGGQGGAAIMVASGGFPNGGTLNLNHGLFANNTNNTFGLCAPAGILNGINTMAVVGSAGFVAPGSPSFNYHIRVKSSAKDQATGSTTTDDIDGQSRPYGNTSDYGADEYWPFPLSAYALNQSLILKWDSDANIFAGGTDHYEIVVTCASGANPPDQGSCGRPIDGGTAYSFTLTGLSNFKPYTLVVNAEDVSGNLVATSTTVNISPTDLIIYLPLLFKAE